MKVNAIKCNKCGDTIYSRARHDMRWCSCRTVAIDGGFEPYYRTAGGQENMEYIELEVDATEKELYADWDYIKDEYGLIKGEVSE